ncbi:MAG: outer membrane beta-barrel protein [Magnetococcus sp. YQC-3]
MRKIAIISSIMLPLCISGTAQTVEAPAEKPYYVSLKIGGSFGNESVGSVKSGVVSTGVIPGVVPGAVVAVSSDDAVAVSASVGMRLHPTVRLELEGAYRKYDADKITFGVTPTKITGHSEIKTLMANAYYDFPVQWQFRPYITGGAGMARSDASVSFAGLTSRGHDTAFSYQLGGGLSYSLSETVTADIGYRYVGAISTEESSVIRTEKDGNLHEILAGLRFGF